MKNIFLALLFCLATAKMVNGQTLSSQNEINTPSHNFIENLASKNDLGARVMISSDTKIELDKADFSQKLRGYRVRIFFDNAQSARTDAEKAAKKFKELYPTQNTYIVYQPPYFKVTAGDFLSREEAVAVWGKILPTFSNSFIVNEDIELTTMLQKPIDSNININIVEEQSNEDNTNTQN